MIAVPLLRHYREHRFMSQQDLARVAGLSRQSICDLEVGKRKARFSTLRKICSALGVHPDAIVGKVMR